MAGNFPQTTDSVGSGSMIPAPTPTMGNTMSVDQEKEKMNQQVAALLTKMQAGGMGMRAPSPRTTPEELQQGGFNMNPAYSKKQDLGQALGNVGMMLHNLGAQHKQRQLNEAMADWQSLDTSLQNAQAKVGPMPDPSSPEFNEWQQKVNEEMQKDSWAMAFMNPQNPKNAKRIKNFTQALHPDVFSDKQNVYGEALKAYQKKKKDMNQQEQQRAQQQLQQLAQQIMQQRVMELIQHAALRGSDPKQIDTAARLIEAQMGREAALEFRKEQENNKLDHQAEVLQMREDQFNQTKQQKQQGIDERAWMDGEIIRIRDAANQIAAHKATLNNDTAGLVDPVRRGGTEIMRLYTPQQRTLVTQQLSAMGETIPRAIPAAEGKILADGVTQMSKLNTWKSTLEMAAGPDGKLPNKPFGTFWDSVKYKVGIDNPMGALISDMSREKWAAIYGLVPGVRRGDILTQMVQHTPMLEITHNDSFALAHTKVDALLAGYALMRVKTLQSYGYSIDPVSGEELKDAEKSYGDHLKTAVDELRQKARTQMQEDKWKSRKR